MDITREDRNCVAALFSATNFFVADILSGSVNFIIVLTKKGIMSDECSEPSQKLTYNFAIDGNIFN